LQSGERDAVQRDKMVAVRRRVFYSGRVQGVGFRFTSVHVSRRFDVAGFVRNLPDGRVEIVVEGQTDQVDRFLVDVVSAMEGAIVEVDSHESVSTGEFASFEVRH